MKGTQATGHLLRRVAAVWLLALGVAGCGYQLRGTGQPVGIQIESISIPMFESTASTLGFEGDLTRLIREEFVSHAKIPLKSREEAQTVLLGRVREIRTEPQSYDVTQQQVGGTTATFAVTETRWLRVAMDVRLLDRSTGTTIWRVRNMEARATFRVSSRPLSNRFREREALREVARRLAERIYAQTMERF